MGMDIRFINVMHQDALTEQNDVYETCEVCGENAVFEGTCLSCEHIQDEYGVHDEEEESYD